MRFTKNHQKRRENYFIGLLKRRGSDKLIFFCVFLLCLFGVIMIGDASIGMAIKFGSSYPINGMLKQMAALFLGGIGMIVLTLKKNLHLNEKIYYFLIGLAYILMIACLHWTVNGTHAWIKIFGFSIQPVEFFKIVMIAYIAFIDGKYITTSKKRASRLYHNNYTSEAAKEAHNKIMWDEIGKPALVVLIGTGICIVIQKDLGSALILVAMALCTFVSAPNKWFKRYKHYLKLGFLGLMVLTFFFVSTKAYRILSPHQAARFASWLEPTNSKYIFGSSYQVVNGLVGYTNGGLIGRGFNNSVMKYGYIPEAQNDYISAIITEEFGLIGILIIILLYGVIIFRLLKYAFKVKDGQSKMTLVGIASYFFLHLFVNLGGVSGLIPMTGVPLLLVSAGGTSTIMALFGIGMAQNIIIAYNKEQLKEAATKDVR